MKFIRIADVGYADAAKEAAIVLRSGGIVLYPTDTLYGLGVNARNSVAIEKLRHLKGREKKKPMSIIVPDVAMLHTYTDLSDAAEAFAHKHLPGALTLVLSAKPELPESLTLHGSIGIRIPNDPFAHALAHAFAAPYTATSANRAGYPTQSTPAEIISHFGHASQDIDLVINDGPRAGGMASTVVRYTDDTPVILREGVLSRKELGIVTPPGVEPGLTA